MKARILLVGIPVACCSIYSISNKKKTHSSLFSARANQEKWLQLQQVQIICRHGARTPIKRNEDFDKFTNLNPVLWDKNLLKVLPCVDVDYSIKSVDGGGEDPVPTDSTWFLLGGCPAGALTTVGQEEAFEFGRWLGSEYITKHALLSQEYTNNEIYVRSTISKRAVQTAVGVMAGLYGRENLPNPLSIHSVQPGKEIIAPKFEGCTRAIDQPVHPWDEIKEGQEEINTLLGLKHGEKPFNFIEVLDVIRSRKQHGLYLPKYLLDREEEVEKCALALQLDILGSDTVEELKGCVGNFVESICCRMQEAIDESMNQTNQTKMILYSSHDTAIISLLLAMGIFDGRWPPFLANIAIELYRAENGEHFVRVLYNGAVVTLGELGESEYISINQFMKHLQIYRTTVTNS